MKSNKNLEFGDECFVAEFTVFLDAREVIRRTSLSRSTVNRMVKNNNFPKPVQIGSCRKAWVESEILAWQMKIMNDTR